MKLSRDFFYFVFLIILKIISKSNGDLSLFSSEPFEAENSRNMKHPSLVNFSYNLSQFKSLNYITVQNSLIPIEPSAPKVSWDNSLRIIE